MPPPGSLLAETIPGVPDQLTGPVAALVLAILVIGGLVKAFKVLWTEHLKADQDDRDQRDKALALLETSLANNKAAVSAWDRRTAADASRHRKADA